MGRKAEKRARADAAKVARTQKLQDLVARHSADRVVVRAVAQPGGGQGTSSGRDIQALAATLVAGRVTADSAELSRAVGTVFYPPQDAESTWRILDLDTDALALVPAHRMIELLVDIQPDMNRALWDFLRLCNPDWTLTAYLPGTREVFPRAVSALADFCERLTVLYGSVDVVFNKLFLNAWLRGALLTELVLDSDARTPIDLATPDPWSIRFASAPDPLRGRVWQLHQMSAGKLEPIDRPTVRYLPLDPLPGAPYGRPLASAAVFTGLFMLGLLHDIRRVVGQQGYPRLDISIDFEAILAALPEDLQDDPDALQSWVKQHVDQVIAAYRKLKPEEAYIHASTITVNRPVGTVDSSSLGGLDPLIKALERMLVKALKTMPLVLGLADGVSEANANRQIELHLLGIQAIQHLAEAALEWQLKLALRAQGIAADVEFRFAQNRAAEALRDEQVRQLKIANASAGYAAGHLDQDQASQYAWGHNADQPEPREAPGAQPPGAALTDGSVKDPQGDTKPADKAGS